MAVLAVPSQVPEPKDSKPAESIQQDDVGSKLEQDATEDDHVWITGVKLWLVMASITLACFVMLVDLSIVATAIPQITNEFHSLPDVGWYGSAYQLASAAVQPLGGKIYTYYKSKWTFLVYFGIFELGSLLCGVARSSTMLIVGRAIAGLGSGGLQNGALTIIAGAIPLQKRALAMGVLMGFGQLGVVSGPLIGGALTEFTTWRWCFYINLPIGAVVAVLVAVIHIPEQVPKPPFRESLRKSTKFLDLVGFVLFAGTTIQILLALQWGGTAYAWNSSVIIGLFVGAGANLAVWLVWNYRGGDDALIPASMMVKTTVWSSALSSLCLMSVLVINSFFMPLYYQAVLGVSPVTSGVYTLPSVISQLLAAVVGGVLITKLGYYLPWALAGFILTGIGNGLGTTLSPTTTTAQWIGYTILMGSGRGFAMQIALVAVQYALPASQISIAVSLLSFSQALGGAVFLTVANTILGNSLATELPALAPTAPAEAIIAAGATAFRHIVSPEQLPGVLLAFAKSIDHIFYLALGLATCGFLFSFGMGWKDTRTKKKASPVGDGAA